MSEVSLPKNLSGRRMNWMCIVALLAMTACSSCKIFSKKDDKKNGADTNNNQALFVENKIFLERTTNLTEAIVRFETTVLANCEIQYWEQNQGRDLAEEERKSIGCSQAGKTQNFSEVITSLKAREIYFFEILAWDVNDNDKNNVSRILVAETELKSENFAFIARVNLPLRSTEIHQIDTTNGVTLASLLDANKISLGCQASNAIAPRPWSIAANANALTAVSMRGYITGTGERSTVNNSRYRIYFNSIQADETWEWSSKTNLGTGQFLAALPPQIQRASITGNNKVDLTTPQLAVAEKAIVQFDNSTDLRVALVANSSAAESSFVKIQLGFPDTEGSMTCYFQASDSSFTVAKAEVAKLPKGKHDIFVSVFSQQIQQDTGKKLPPWLIEAYDWRVARIEVL